MIESLSVWWAANAKPWLRRWGFWIVAGLVAVFTLGRVRMRRSSTIPPPPSDTARRIANALRPGLQKRADEDLERSRADLAEARAHEAEAERIRDEVRSLPDEDLSKRIREYAARKRRENPGGPLLALLLALTASPAAADDARVVEDARHPETGALGVWLHPSLARELLADAESLPSCEARAAKAESSAERAQRSADERKAELELDREVIAEAEARLRAALRERDQARKERDAWFRSPWALSTGVMVGALISGLGVLAVVSR